MSAKMEKYKSKAAMMKHEKTEGKAERKMEYGNGLFGKKTMKKAVAKKAVAKKAVAKKMGKKK